MKAVLFDAAGVLTEPLSADLVTDALEAGADPEVLMEVLLPIFSGAGSADSIGNQLERGEVTLDAFLDSLGDAKDDIAMVIDPQSPTFFGRAWTGNQTVQDFAEEVHKAGFRTALVSNNVREWQATWDRVVPPSLHFDLRVYSWKIGARKPEPAMYQQALDGLEVAAGEALFIDDFPAMAAGARELGMTAIDFVEAESAIGEARELLGLR